MGIGRHVRFFKRQVDNQVSRGPQTNQESEPPDDSHVRRHSKKHTGEYSRRRNAVYRLHMACAYQEVALCAPSGQQDMNETSAKLCQCLPLHQ